MQEVTLSYGKIDVTYLTAGVANATGAPAKGTWDLNQNKGG